MINFSADFLENFLAVVRKYMQLRGGLTQKDLSEMTGVGISTMSRSKSPLGMNTGPRPMRRSS